MSPDEKVAVVESFLNCMASDELDRLPIDPEFTVESPLIPKLSGQAAMEYVKAVAASTTGIRVVQHQGRPSVLRPPTDRWLDVIAQAEVEHEDERPYPVDRYDAHREAASQAMHASRQER